jgi:large subunit ribosomal protein L6
VDTKELKTIGVPQAVEVQILDNQEKLSLAFNGPLGNTSLDFPSGFSAEENTEEATLSIECSLPSPKRVKQLMGTYTSLTKQKIEGVSQGFKRQLTLVGVGYRASVEENTLILRLGYSHEIVIDFDASLSIVCPNQTTIFIKGTDLVKVTQKAAEIRSWRLPEPYKGKGIFYKGETVRRKDGKKN